MTARIKIDQVGLPAGVAGRSRSDGLATGALVTLEDVSGTGSSTFHLLWGPVEDTTAEASLAVTGDPDIWTFSPTAAAYGSYEIELRDDGIPVERRIFGIRTPANQLLIPALNERASRHAGWHNDGADQIDLCEQNANDFPLAALNNYRYAGWWRSLYELYRVVEFGIGSIANNALALIKLVKIPAKSILANTSNVLADVTTLAGSAAYQYPRVNAANNALEMATLSAHASTSIVYDGASNTWQRAALTGAVTAAQNSNICAFGDIAANSFLLNATGSSGPPTAVAGATVAGAGLTYAAGVLAVGAGTGMTANANDVAWNGVQVRKNSTGSTFTRRRLNVIEGPNTTLTVADDAGNDEVAVTVNATPGQFALTANTTASGTVATIGTGNYTIPANEAAVGSVYRFTGYLMCVRGGTATANDIVVRCVLDGITVLCSATITTITTALTKRMRVEVLMTFRTIGGAGTVEAEIFCASAFAAAASQITADEGTTTTDAIATNANRVLTVDAAMSANVAGTSITWTQAVWEKVR